MNEKDFEYPLRKRLQELMPEAIVIKHYDAGMIGMWDCSVITGEKIYALEFKLWRPPLRIEEDSEFITWVESECQKKFHGPQHQLMLRMSRVAKAWYVIALPTGGVVIVDPESHKQIWACRKSVADVLTMMIARNIGFRDAWQRI